MYVEDFRRLLQRLGCPDFRTVSRSRVALGSLEIEAKVGLIDFYSMKIRAFKLSGLEDICEDYGQVAYYLGTIREHPFRFSLDDHHTFEKGRPMLVCGNTAAMLAETRFGRHFKVLGDRSVHHGPFDCSPATGTEADGGCGGSCC